MDEKMHTRNMMINSRLGLEQGRGVFAVPGIAQSVRSKGAHRLIRQGAKLVEGVEDVLEEIRPLIRPAHSLPPLPDQGGDRLFLAKGRQTVGGPPGSKNPAGRPHYRRLVRKKQLF